MPDQISSKSSYRPDIDGLRAIAVLSVMAFHYGAPIPGGFTGVDIFFVISGFLITQRLATEIASGSFSLLAFYDRRIRRILPALLVMLVVSLLVGKILLLPGDYKSLAASAAASTFGASNFYFLGNTGYFDQASDLMPLLHTWSLAVEEQFYLVWPLLLFVIAAGRSRADTAAIASAIVIIGFGVSIVWFSADTKGAFYMVLPRAWELALGAALVFLPPLPRWTAEIAATIGFWLIVLAMVVVQPQGFPGSMALLPCLGAALVIWPRATRTWSERNFGFLAPIGLVSYSLYLWHWPVWVFFRIYINNGKPAISEAVALSALSILLAWLSWRFVEQPFRRPRWPAAKSVAAGLAGCMAIFCAGMCVHSSDGAPERLPSELHAMSSLTVMWQWPCDQRDLAPHMKNVCVFGAPWDASKHKAILWGDSIAATTAPFLGVAAKRSGVGVVLYFRCSPVLDGEIAITTEKRMDNYNQYCKSTREALFAQLRASDEIKTVILTSSWQPTFNNLDSSDKTKMFTDSLLRTVESLQALGRRVIIINNPPLWPHDPIPCALLAAGLPRRQCGSEAILSSKHYFDSFNGRFFPVLASNRPDLRIIDTGAAMCGPSECLTVVNGEHIYLDAAHLRRNLTEETNKDLAELMGLDRIFD